MNDSRGDEIAKLESLYAMNPEGRVFTHLAEACRKAGQLDRAREILEDGLRRHPDYASAHVVLGRVLTDCGEAGNAAAEFRRVLELDRHNLVALRSLGELASGQGDIKEAIHYYSELAVLDPTDTGLSEELKSLRDRLPAEDGASAAEADASPVEVPSESDASGHEAVVDSDGHETEAMAAEEPTVENGEVHGDTGSAVDDGTAEEIVGDSEVEEDHVEVITEEEEAAAATLEAEFVLDEETAEPLDLQPLAGFEPTVGGGEFADGMDSTVAIEAIETVGSIDGSDIGAGIDVPDLELEPRGDLSMDLSVDAAITPADSWADALASEEPNAGDEVPVDDSDAADFESAAGDPVDDVVDPAADETVDTGSDVEGRWQEPETIQADHEAERSGPPPDTGEWIPSERWEWVAASADTESGPIEAAEDDGEAVPATEPESESPAEPDWLSGVGAEVAAEDEDETSFASLNIDVADSLEEGAAAVLDAFALDIEDAGQEEDGEPPPADWLTAETAGAESEVAEVLDTAEPVSWSETGDDSGDQVITETLAEIYASQGLYERAADVYRRLVAQNPDDERLTARLGDLESATEWTDPSDEATTSAEETEAFLSRVESAWTGGEGAADADESPYTWPAEAGGPESETGTRVGDYFAALLAWRPSHALPSMDASPTESNEEVDAVGAWFAGEGSQAKDEESTGREGEEDLEMFRSWLESLKK